MQIVSQVSSAASFITSSTLTPERFGLLPMETLVEFGEELQILDHLKTAVLGRLVRLASGLNVNMT